MNSAPFGVYCWLEKNDGLDQMRQILGYFQLLPTWILVFYYALAIALSDLFFIVTSLALNYGVYFYMLRIARAGMSERPPAFDHTKCCVPQYALPDALFVTTLTFWCSVGVGLVKHPRYAFHVGWFYRILLVFLPIMFVVGLMVNEYLYWWQLLANLAISAITTVLYLFTYAGFVSLLKTIPGCYAWLSRTCGMDVAVFCETPMYATIPSNG